MQNRVYVVINQISMGSYGEVISVHSTIEKAKSAAEKSNGRSEIHCFLMDETEDLREKRRKRMNKEIDDLIARIRSEYEIGRL